MGKFGLHVFRGTKKNIITFIGAILIIAVGVFICVSGLETVLNLRQRVQYFYEEGRLADVFVNVRSMPVSDLRRLREMEGVDIADGRLSTEVRMLSEDMESIVSVHLMGYRPDMALNQVLFRADSHFQPDSIYIGRKMEVARNLQAGQKVSLIIHDAVRTFTYSGSVVSPDYIYALPPSGAFNSDGSDYDIALIDNRVLEEYLDKKGVVNEIGIKLLNRTSYEDVKDELRVFFEKYGLLSMTEREKQTSYDMVESEIEELIYSGTFVPALFMLMSVFMLYIVLKRSIDNERVRIGTMKALGMRNTELILPYLIQAVVIGLLGTLLGIYVGGFLGVYYLQVYGEFFALPNTEYHAFLDFRMALILVNIAVCLIAVFIGVREVIHIKPAEAMRNIVLNATAAERFPIPFRLNAFTKMGLRSMARSKLRTILISAAIGFPFGMGLCLFSFMPNFNKVFNVFEYSQAYDIGLTLDGMDSKQRVEGSALGIKYITESEAIAQLPIRLKKENREISGLLFGLNEDSNLYRIYDVDGNVRRWVQPSQSGLILNSRLANQLDLRQGDELEVQIPTISNRWTKIRIERVIKEATGGGVYLDLDAFEKIFGVPVFANRLLVNAQRGHQEDIKAQIIQSKKVQNITDTKWIQDEYKRLFSNATVMIDMFIYMTGFAGVVLIYNIMLISARERATEYATLKLLGISMRELKDMLLAETICYLVLGLCIGLPVAMLIRYILEGMFQPESFTLEIVFTPLAYAKAGGMCLIIVWFTVFSVIRFIRAINPVDSLKERS